MVTHPMNIAELIKPETILLDLNVSTRNRLFEEIARKLEQQYGLNRDQIVKSLIAREELGSTALGLGMALPHARLKGLTEAKAVYVRTTLALPFDAPDGKPVSHVLALLVPERATEAHLQLLASVAQLFSDQDFRQRLRSCATPDAVYQLFQTSAQA
ncbi:Nitrogen regulatory protein [Amantichitinum ursilacus]|uniref:Nitrogen regulatory protein n=2 Tax=Amantichitinum ursilacus TaxID=857265 RepID=A0A0N1JT17_9NEIS|nr:Nitrogen regulatory protein [Amantichitinum ursilacus]